MKILLLDIETAPNTAHVWGLFDQNVPLTHVLESSYVLCWSAKWLGKSEIMFSSVYHDNPKKMLKKIHGLLDEADAVIHFNGTKFDIPTLNKEFVMHHFSPPSPYKQMDLLKVVRTQFKFLSNKLDYLAKELGVGEKTKYISHMLWIRCMHGDESAWVEMEKYNKNDVLIMEKVYYVILPWMKTHANYSMYVERDVVCPNCGKSNYQCRGYAVLQLGKYQRYQCKECASWFRSTKRVKLSSASTTVL